MANKNPEDRKYAESHEWIKVSNGDGTCGITDHAQELLTDIVFVELPEKGKKIKKGDRVAVVESVKSVSDIYSPVSGEITAVNEKLNDSPELINSDPFGEGWIFTISLDDKAELSTLLSSVDYEKTLEGENA
ncbi:MAG TPA: glycine cleavage system protein GcvH [Spirochaetia bacterium]|nr:glycine cleavage system protein GcvH [Spirochaetia bacterium]